MTSVVVTVTLAYTRALERTCISHTNGHDSSEAVSLQQTSMTSQDIRMSLRQVARMLVVVV